MLPPKPGRRWIGTFVAAATLGFAAAAAPANAAVRYATPTGAGTDCSAAAPCSLTTAIGSAPASSEIVVAPGSYGSTASPLAPLRTAFVAGVSVHGVEGQDPPVIYATGPALQMRGASPTVANLHIEQVSTAAGQNGLEAQGAGTVVDRVYVHTVGINNPITAGASFACAGAADGRWTNSVCWTTGGNPLSLNMTSGTTTVRNMTLYAGTSNYAALAVYGSAPAVVNLSNSLPESAMYADSGVHVNVDHSDTRYGTFGAGTFQMGDGNIATGPTFVDAPHGDFHQGPGSSSIDAGASDPANGTLDLDGNLRSIGSLPDIGAYEAAHAPVATTGAADGIDTAGATLHGTVDTGGSRTTYSFEYGATTSYGSSTAATTAPPAAGATPVSAPVTGLAPGTVVHYRVVATNRQGTSGGLDQTFTTAVPTAPPPGGGGDGGGGGGDTTQPPSSVFTAAPPAGCAAAACDVKVTVPGPGSLTATDADAGS
ncbi:MAG: hypothetical protein QOC80_2884, partial [Frankiaceae bacterium]|nr:hypothetical protein [Frankiaceae bacterium]